MNTVKELKKNISKKDLKKYISTKNNKIQSSKFYKGLHGWYIVVETKQDINKSSYLNNLTYFDIQTVNYKHGFLYSTQYCTNPVSVHNYIEYLKNELKN